MHDTKNNSIESEKTRSGCQLLAFISSLASPMSRPNCVHQPFSCSILVTGVSSSAKGLFQAFSIGRRASKLFIVPYRPKIPNTWVLFLKSSPGVNCLSTTVSLLKSSTKSWSLTHIFQSVSLIHCPSALDLFQIISDHFEAISVSGLTSESHYRQCQMSQNHPKT